MGRPILNLGAMGGDQEYVKNRSEALVQMFNALMGKNIELRDGPQGVTDCETFIEAPICTQYDAYLTVEHELSHHLFGTDLALVEAFREKAVERLFRRAGMAPDEPGMDVYRRKLGDITHGLWNMLEDHRVAGLWAQLYEGGGKLLRKRWSDISEHELGEQAKVNLLSYLLRKAAGSDTPEAPDAFKNCDLPLRRALNQVEGVNAAACLAITARFLDEIADELLDEVPPEQDPQQGQQGGQQGQQQGAPQAGGSGGRKKGKPSKQQQQAQSKKKMEQLSKAVPAAPQQPSGGMGKNNLKKGPKTNTTAKKRLQITKLLGAKDNDAHLNASGQSSFEDILADGADDMQGKIEDIQKAMMKPQGDPESKKADLLTANAKVVGIGLITVTPTLPLPPPSPAAGLIRQKIQKMRMQRRRHMDFEGELDVDAYLDAKMSRRNPHEEKIFNKRVMEQGMELLILGDVSGSMAGAGQVMLDRAVSDTVAGCEDSRTKVHQWCFSSQLFVFTKPGATTGETGIRMGMTNMVQAVEMAADWMRLSKTTRALILMTDGGPTSVRSRNSTGNANEDMKQVLKEMREDKLILSVLAIGSLQYKDFYDNMFGAGRYGLLGSLQDLLVALPKTAEALVEAHIRKGT
jgi:hypothetical protein